MRENVQFSKHKTHTHTHTVSLIPPWEDQCEWYRMTRMTGPDCAVTGKRGKGQRRGEE